MPYDEEDMSSIVKNSILNLNLPYEIEYAILNLEDEELVKRQRDFFGFLTNRKNDNLITSLESDDINSRIFAQNVLENAKSIIVILFPYLTDEHSKNGNLSMYCMGMDYHISVKDMLCEIVKYIKNFHKDADFYIQSDTGTLNERFFAFYSGVGRLGINSMIFSDIYGSYVNIGLIVTDLLLDEKKFEKKYCDKCMACVKSCPGGAINGDFTINSYRCASYITQKKGELNEQEQGIIKKSKKIFGCDVCQNVCHFNNNVKTIPKNCDIIKTIKNEDIDELSNKKFKEKYILRAFNFRGKSVIKRNLDILKDD